MRCLWWYLHDFSSTVISNHDQSGAVMSHDERCHYTVMTDNH